MKRARYALLSLIAVLGVVASSNAVIAAPVAGHAQKAVDLSSDAGVARYLRSVGVDPSRAVYQHGARNYAGPSCPGASWSCTDGSRPVVQKAAAGGKNVFQCSPASPGTNPNTNTCVVIQTTVTGTNTAVCKETNTTSPASQSCSITQTNTSGNNSADVEQTIDQKDGTTQSADQTATVTQRNVSGDNGSDIDQIIKQDSKVHSSATISQAQEANQSATADQQATASGDNDSAIDQSEDQKADAHGESSTFVEQGQNASNSGPDVSADVEQSSGSGQNSSDLEQSTDQDGKVHTKGGEVDQTQSSFGGGLAGTVNQSSTGLSTSDNHQKENQKLEADSKGGPVFQAQHGPHTCCSDQGSNPNDTFNIEQSSVQKADAGADQTEEGSSDCDTSGNCTTHDVVVQNGQRTETSCSAPSCHTFIFCAPPGDGEGFAANAKAAAPTDSVCETGGGPGPTD